ncbi:retrovirus-related pol polyprotein from transposon TNT 1-94, partial [Tanacetum coccineum]
EAKQVEVDDQAIQSILMGLHKDIYVAVDSCNNAKDIWLHVQKMMKGADIGVQEAKLLNKLEKFKSVEGESIESYYHHFAKLMIDLDRNQLTPKNIACNLKAKCSDSDWAECRESDWNIGNRNGLIVVLAVGNHNGNAATARVENNGNGNNANQIRCYNCRGVGHYDRNCTARPKKRDVAYLQTQLLIAQKEEAGLQLNAEEYDLMAAAADCEEEEEFHVNCILMASLQQASMSGTHADTALVYNSDGSVEDDSNIIHADFSMDLSGGM